MIMLRSRYHSFWHHDIRLPGPREKVQRRVDRFLSLGVAPKPLVFVRHAARTGEVARSEALLAALTARFGPEIYLLICIGKQHFEGPVFHSQDHRLIFYPVSRATHEASPATPFAAAVQWIVEFVRHRDEPGRSVSCPLDPVGSGAQLQAVLAEDDYACYAFDGLTSFEDPPVQYVAMPRPAMAAGRPARRLGPVLPRAPQVATG
mmetsp:Transcript_131729/g.299536  ORF Transcript_131729/g.299536 Transcript_131729/m.299536 type:complete len:205 (+) Transcript_131729:3-617(+)